jgi:hypothetical protein
MLNTRKLFLFFVLVVFPVSLRMKLRLDHRRRARTRKTGDVVMLKGASGRLPKHATVQSQQGFSS